MRLLFRPTTGQGRLHHHIQARHTWDHPQELTDITQGALAHLQDVPGLRAHQLPPLAVVLHADAAARRQIVAVQGAQQGALARAGLAMQDQALAARHTEIHGAQHVEDYAVLLMQSEGFREVTDLDQGIHHRVFHY
ncbi:hypothetical protein D3C87_1623520 [compost metagenome]